MFILLTLNLSFFFSSKRTDISQVPIIVDLKDVKISEMTNLPPKAKIAEQTTAPTSVTKTPPSSTSTKKEKEKINKADEKADKTKPDDELAKKPKQDFLEAPTPDKSKDDKKTDKSIISPPKQPKKPTPPKPDTQKAKPEGKSKAPELNSSLKNLLASVNTLEKNLGAVEQQATVQEGTKVDNMGIEGGTSGSYFSQLSISEIDSIAGRLRACWNLDPGAKGAQNMIIEVRAYLNQDGSLKEARIVDMGRYGSEPHFRAVADSARRAVYTCSPYTIFSDKYSDKYDMWKTMLLKFNPLDGNIN